MARALTWLVWAMPIRVAGSPFGGWASHVQAQAQSGVTVNGEGFAPNSEVTLVDANDVIATGTADASGNVTFTNVPEGNFMLVGVDAAGNVVATTAAVTGAAVAAGAAIAAGAATAAVAATAVGAVAAAAHTAGALGAVGGVLGATAIAAGIAAGTASFLTTQDDNVTICHVRGGSQPPTTLQVNQTELAGHQGHGDALGACPASP